MDSYEFTELDDRGKAFAIWHYGVHLLTRAFGSKHYKLYALNDFYVEVTFHGKNVDYKRIQTFESINFLEPYFELLDLSELWQSESGT